MPTWWRAKELANLLTVEELVSQMSTDGSVPTPPISRLGVSNSYVYGIESLHGVAADCPIPGDRGRCFTNFPVSSALVASFNRSLWYMFGRAMGDEARWAYSNGYLPGAHMRGPQLNPQRDPRWGRNDNSPGEDAYLQGEYGARVVLGAQGAARGGAGQRASSQQPAASS